MTNDTQEALTAPLDARTLLGFNFPTADLVDAAAALFERPSLRQESSYARTIDGWSERASELKVGSWPELQIGPGLVGYRRRDRSGHDRQEARRHELAERAFRRRKAEHDRQSFAPMALALSAAEIASLDAPVSVAPRGDIVGWSSRSRMRLVKAIVSMDLAPLVTSDRLPVMVTLTLPDRWLEVMRDGAEASRKFDRFRRAWAHKWGSPSWIWKREFQARGAPHWHLWLVPPPVPLREFHSWLSRAWTDALDIADPGERARSYRAGTNVSQADGMAARDPKRLAIYFLKESLGGESKAYQNRVPREWGGEKVGRFWGYAGIDLVVRTVELDPRLADMVWRVLRHVRASKGVTRRVLVERIDQRTGVIRYRSVRRRAKARGSAGWVAVNDGAALASQLARWIDAHGAAVSREPQYVSDPDHQIRETATLSPSGR